MEDYAGRVIDFDSSRAPPLDGLRARRGILRSDECSVAGGVSCVGDSAAVHPQRDWNAGLP